MYLKTILICAFLISHTFTDVDGKRSWGGSSNSRKSGGGLFSRSKTTPRPRTQHQTPHSGGSEPGKIGWNVPQKDKGTSINTAPKPSAPQSEVISKTSATNSQSGYQPSGGYSHNQPSGNPPPYSSHPAGNPPPYSSHPVGNPPPPYSSHNSYNPSVGGGYHAPPSYSPPGGGYNPPVGGGYNPPIGGGYNPSYGYHGGAPMGGGSFAQPQTIYVQSAGQPSRSPGIGQLAKEAVVYAGVSAGVNAAVNRIIPGGIYGTRSSSSESHVVGGGAPTYTSITNNYYNGSAPSPAEGGAPAAPAAPAAAAAPASAPGAAAPAPAAAAAAAPAAETPQNAQSNPQTDAAAATTNQKDGTQQAANNNNLNPLGYVISDDDIKKFTEDLFGKDKNNAFSHITVKLQGQKKDDSTTDDAPEPLLEVKPEAYEIPTIKAVLPLHNNYELDVKTKEDVTSEKRQEESELLDKFLDTEVFKTTMKFLANKGYVPDDEYEFKDTLKRMWFSKFKRTDAEASSCGFEAVFLAEKFDNEIIGLHNWIYYAQQEANKNMNYLGYIKEVSLGDKGKVLKVRSTLNGITQPVTSIFVGTSPELEMALYTMCFFTRPGAVCPMSLGGTEFVIIVNRVNYFGKDILISAYPEI